MRFYHDYINYTILYTLSIVFVLLAFICFLLHFVYYWCDFTIPFLILCIISIVFCICAEMYYPSIPKSKENMKEIETVQHVYIDCIFIETE